MAAAAIPALVKVGTAVGGSLLGKKLGGANKQQQAGMQATQQATGDLSGASKGLLAQGGAMVNQGSSYLQKAGNYYGTLLGGDRAAMRQAVAPQMNGVMDYYKGASSKASRTLRGGSRDNALAELDRSKVGTMASTLAGARRDAAEGAADIGGAFMGYGTQASGQGIYGAGTAAQAGNQLYGQGSDQNAQQGSAGKAAGGLIYDIINSTPWGKKMGKPKVGGLYGGPGPMKPNLPQGTTPSYLPSPSSTLGGKRVVY